MSRGPIDLPFVPQCVWLVPWAFNPPLSGAPIRTYHLIGGLARRGLVVVRPALNASQGSPYPPMAPPPHEWTYPVQAASRWRVWNPAARSHRGKALFQMLDSLVRLWEKRATKPVVIFDSGYLAVPAIWLARKAGAHLVYSSHNCETEVWEQLHASSRSWRQRISSLLSRIEIEREEREAVRRSAVTWCCSSRDASRFDAWDAARAGKRWLVPNGVNADVVSLQAVAEAEPRTLCYIGYLGTDQNHEACLFLLDRILPLIRRHVGDVRVVLAGRNARPELRSRAEAGVEVISPLDTPVRILRRSRLSLIPLLQGGGTRLKILEALAAGRPVVATAKAAEGLDRSALSGLAIADTAEALAEAVVAGLRTPLTDTDAVAARTSVLRTYDWKVIADALDHKMRSRFPEAMG